MVSGEAVTTDFIEAVGTTKETRLPYLSHDPASFHHSPLTSSACNTPTSADRRQGLAAVPGLHELRRPSWRPWVLDEAAAQPFFRRAVESGHQLLRHRRHVLAGRRARRSPAGPCASTRRLEECVVATKVFNAMGDGPNMPGLSRKHIQQGCEASLRRLGVETIDLYQIHRFDPHTPIDETLAALDLLVRQGKVRYLGASSTAAWQFAQVAVALRAARLGAVRRDAEPLQPGLSRGRARDDSALPGGGDRGHSLVAAGPRPAGRHAQDADEQPTDAPGRDRRLRPQAVRSSGGLGGGRSRAPRRRARAACPRSRAGVAAREARRHAPRSSARRRWIT